MAKTPSRIIMIAEIIMKRIINIVVRTVLYNYNLKFYFHITSYSGSSISEFKINSCNFFLPSKKLNNSIFDKLV